MPASKTIIAEVLQDENTPASAIYPILLNEFGSEMHEWEPETIWMEIQDEYGIDLVDCNKDKLIAVIGLLTTNSFYENFQAFEAIGKSLNGQTADFEWVTPLTPEEATWAVIESKLLDETPEEFSREIQAYVREVLREGGLYTSPPALSFCNISATYPAEKYVPMDLLKTVSLNQDIKLKKIEAYVALQKKRLDSALRKALAPTTTSPA